MIKKVSIKMLCKLGKFGVGKSLTLGMFDIQVPKKLLKSSTNKKIK